MNEKNNNRKWKGFGDFLKLVRQNKKLTRKELGQEVNKGESTIASWEHGLRRPRPKTMLLLANCLRIPIQEFQSKAGYTPEFDWILSLSEKSRPEVDIFSNITEEEKTALKQYLLFLRFSKQAKSVPISSRSISQEQ
jgi:transcriptional regulator with XRE-family HTH domain